MNKNTLLGLIMPALYCFSVHAMELQTYYLITPKQTAQPQEMVPQEPAQQQIALVYIGDLKALEKTTLGNQDKFLINEHTFRKSQATAFTSIYDGYADFLNDRPHDGCSLPVRACIFEASKTALEKLTPPAQHNVDKYAPTESYTVYFANKCDIYNDLTEKTPNDDSFIKALLFPNEMYFWTTLQGLPTKKNSSKQKSQPQITPEQSIKQSPLSQAPETKESLSLESTKSLERKIFILQMCSGLTIAGLLGLFAFLFRTR